MKTGIIGLPQVGKTSLFQILTKAHLSEQARANPREAHIGVAKVPDDRLDRLAALYSPKKLTHASVEYVDVGAIGQDALKDTAYSAHLRQVDALAHVVRVFDDPSIPHVDTIDPLRDIKNVEFDLMVSDLGQIEKRLERLEKDLKKMKTPDLEKEFELIKRANAHLGNEKPLREMEMTPEDKKRLRGFMFLSEKPILYVLNIGESTELGKELEEAVGKHNLTEIAARPNAGATAICGKVEAELSEMSDADAAEFGLLPALHGEPQISAGEIALRIVRVELDAGLDICIGAIELFLRHVEPPALEIGRRIVRRQLDALGEMQHRLRVVGIARAVRTEFACAAAARYGYANSTSG